MKMYFYYFKINLNIILTIQFYTMLILKELIYMKLINILVYMVYILKNYLCIIITKIIIIYNHSLFFIKIN